MNEVDRVKAICNEFMEYFDELNLNYVIFLKTKMEKTEFMIYTNALAEEAVCTITNTVPMIFYPEWSGLPWDMHSSNVASKMTEAFIEKLEPYTEKALVCLALTGDDSRGGIIKYQHTIQDALECMLQATQQLYNLLEKVSDVSAK